MAISAALSDPVTIRSLHVYPVKGCAAVDVDASELDARGLIVGDRQAMIVDATTGAFLSQRHEPRLARLIATLDAGQLTLRWPGASPTTLGVTMNGPSRSVTVWDDTFEAIDCGDAISASLSAFVGRAVRLVRLPRESTRVVDAYWAGEGLATTFADLAPILVTSTRSLDDLNARRATHGRSPVEMARFRPNVVIDGLDAWREDEVGSLHGDAGSLSLFKPSARCKVIELWPPTGDATGDAVLASLAAFRGLRNRRGTFGVMFGQNATFRSVGRRATTLRVGDALAVGPQG